MPVLSDASVTALDIIKRALKVRKVLGPNEPLGSNDSADALVSLNAMLKGWSARSVTVFQILQEQQSLIAGTAAYTIGPDGDFNTDRPLDIVGGWCRDGDVDWPLMPVSRDRYDAITVKGTQGRPNVIYYQPSVPLGTVTFYFVPDRAYTIALNSWLALERFSSLTAQVELPPEYEECLVYQLARRLTSFGGRMDPEDVTIASEAWQTVSTVNSRIPEIETEIGYLNYGVLDITTRTIG